MSAPVPYVPSALGQPPRLSRLGVTVVWAFITATVIAMTSLGIAMKTGKVDLLERLVWDIGWMGWAPLTFLVFRLCNRFPIDRHHKLNTTLRLAALGLGVVAVEIAFDFACNIGLGLTLRHSSIGWGGLPYICVYKSHIYYGVFWMIVGAAHAWEYHQRYRKSELVSSQLESRLARAELDRLKTQLQPHFLFNTHNTIVALMLKHDNDAAIRMLTRLSDLLRISLARSGEQLVTVREELESLRLYLDIQRERFGDRLTLSIEAPEDVHHAKIPHLLLQPLVENAFQHGLEHATENGRLSVCLRRENDSLVCTVTDNGAGIRELQSIGVAGKNSGIGLANTRERLQQLFGPRQSLEISSAEGSGCSVIIRMPYLTDQAVMALA